MRKMNCQSVCREIEAADLHEMLSPDATEHLANCRACATFSKEHIKLRSIVSGLGTIEAPSDFDFRLRARLAGEKPGIANNFSIGNFSFRSRSVAFATLLLLFGSGLLLVSLRSSDDSRLASQGTPAATGVDARDLNQAATDVSGQETQAELAVVKDELPIAPVSAGAKRPGGSRALVASAPKTRRLKTREMGSATAAVLRQEDLRASASDFPIETSKQSFKVSLDDGRGSSRTISLPTVSFGSQRVVSQATSPLVASARGSW